MSFFTDIFTLPPMHRAFWVAVLAAPFCALIGSFITLKRLAFFSHAVSHSAITGLALGFTFHLSQSAASPGMQVALAIFCMAIALLMAWLFENTTLPPDTIMAFSFTGSVALGVILISRIRDYQVLEGVLFGDILAARWTDLWTIGALGVAVAGFIAVFYRPLALSVVNETLARLEGYPVRRMNYLFIILISLVVAVLMRQLGALLVNGMLVIPAAAARSIAGSFRQMLWFSVVIGVVGAVAGIFSSYHMDMPTGPALVLAQVVLLAACLVAGGVLRRASALRHNRRALNMERLP